MDTLGYILLFNFIGSIVSLLGGVFLISFKRISISKYTNLLSSFAAGTLLGAVFFDVLPEGVHEAEEMGIGHDIVFMWVLGGILFFFLLERWLHWFHHHEYTDKEIKGKPVIPLITIGDSLHNFVDGAAIAVTFMVSVPVGILTTFAVAAHEIPQEIGDFGIMIHKGLSRKRVLTINLLSAAFSFLGALLAFFLGESFEFFTIFLLALGAGFFLYISLADIIPEIHNENRRGIALKESGALVLGVTVVFLGLFILQNVLHVAH